jgi:predicted dehydrogenase
MSNPPLRIGVAGVGFGATVHIPAFQSEGVDVVAVTARRPERAQEAAEKFGIPNVFATFDEMLAMDGLDAVSIVTPPATHHEMTMAAIKAGKHIICEKPFAVDEAEAREMWQAAEGSGLTTIIAHEFRYSSGRSMTKELIEQGYIGKLRFCLMRLVMPWQLPSSPRPGTQQRVIGGAGSGLLFTLGSHYVDCLRDWFGEVESVSGVLKNFAQELPDDETVDSFADDTFSFRLNFVNGGLAEMMSSRSGLFGSGSTVEVYGTEGSIFTPQNHVNPPAHGIVMGGKTGDDKLSQIEVPERLQPIADDRDDRMAPFRLQVRDFVKGIETGTSPAPNFYDGWRNQQVLDAIRESAKTERTVAIASE